MNERDERERGETRSRRTMLATAGGLLLPAGLRAADGDNAEAKATTRRMPRPELRYWANDTVFNFRNATDQTVLLTSHPGHSHGPYRVEPGKETGFGYGIPAWKLRTDTELEIGVNQKWFNVNTVDYKIEFETNEIGTPDVTISRKSGRDYLVIQPGERDMAPNDTFEITHHLLYLERTFRFHVHRWADGKEPLDDYDEWYTRFYVTLYNA